MEYRSFASGQLGNQLYYLLQAYIHKFIYVYEGSYMSRENADKLKRYLERLNVNDLYTTIDKYKGAIIHEKNYCNRVGIDFTEDQLNDFINATILQSEAFNSAKSRFVDNDHSVAVHIRNTDYFAVGKVNHHVYFDRDSYFKNAIRALPEHITSCSVFSDDIRFTKEEYGDIFNKGFDTVNYIPRGDDLDDFFDLSLYKNKILINSTYSYWAAYIGRVLYGLDSFIITPAAPLIRESNITDHVLPIWYQVPIIIK